MAKTTDLDRGRDLAAFESKTWRDLSAKLLARHATLPIYAGDILWRVTLPGYLRYLLHEHNRLDEVFSNWLAN